MKSARIHYAASGWVIDTPFALNAIELTRAISYHRKVQTDRIRTMTGDKRHNCLAALAALAVNTIRQNVLKNEWNEHILLGR